MPEFGPGSIMRADYFRSGNRLQTEHIPTQIRPKRKKGTLPDYAGHALAQVCSPAFRDVVDAHDPGLHQFVPVEIVWKDGSVPSTSYPRTTSFYGNCCICGPLSGADGLPAL